MSKRIRLEVDNEIEKNGWDRAARVTVQLKDGRRFSELVIHFRGTPKNPLSLAELEEKARRLTHFLLAPQKLERLGETILNLEKVKKVSQVRALLDID
jgi:2-methylcitrate dehydratase PrpD